MDDPLDQPTPQPARSKNGADVRLALALGVLAASMVGAAYAAVPLYRIFCQVTGFAGTTQRAVSAPAAALDRMITIRFDANTSNGLAWKFAPLQRTIETPIGEQTLAFYRATNPTNRTITGTATFNVTPEIAGSHFSKIECFCFTEQVLKPGESVDMPVSFFVDPGLVDDPDARDISEITLSYTFFEAEPAEAAAVKSSPLVLQPQG